MGVGEAGAAKQEVLTHGLKAEGTWLTLLADPWHFSICILSKDIQSRLPSLPRTLFMAESLAKEAATELHLPDNIIALKTALMIGFVLRSLKLWIENSEDLAGLPLFQE